jgi:hypothetical protein
MRYFLIILLYIIVVNSYSITWTKEYNGVSSSEKINLTEGGKVSHYKNSGNWKDSLGNYGTQKCFGTILLNAKRKIKDWILFCEGMDQDRNTFVLEYFRNSDMEAGTGSYTFIDGNGKWKKFIGTKCNYAINYLDNAMFNFDKCESKIDY